MASLSPLSARVNAPATAPLPVHADVALWRPMTIEDLDAVMVAVHAADRVDHPTWTTPAEDIADFFEMDDLDATTDSLIGLDEDGSVIAWAWANRAAGQLTRVQAYASGSVIPSMRGRGIGRQVLAWGLARAQQQLGESESSLPGWILNFQEESNVAARHLAERAGLVETRWFTAMNRVLAEPIEAPGPRSGIRVVPFGPQWREAARLARNDSFRDHWGSQPTVPQRWAAFVEGALFRDDLSFIAVEDAEPDTENAVEVDGRTQRVVAFALSTVNKDDWETQGYTSLYLALIGVVRDRRGMQLAPAVIAAVLAAGHAAGLERADLDVDSASSTGANTLYERLGFHTREREVGFVREY